MANTIKYLRTFHSKLYVYPAYSRFMSTKPEVSKQEPAAEEISVHDIMKGPLHSPSNLDKRILVFTGRFKKIEEIPKTVSAATMDKSRNKARIKIANYMMLATAIACVGMAISGRRAAERGESLHQMNLDWHKEMNKK